MEIRNVDNAPPLAGWVIACAAGLVAFGVSLVAIGLGGMGSLFVATVITLVVGVIFTIAEPRTATVQRPAATTPNGVDRPTNSAAAPAAAPASAASDGTAVSASAEKPVGISAPSGAPDDLKQISGVGPVLESKLNGLGIYHFWQIASWSDAEIEWVDGFLNFKGRITRDNWVSQAERMAQSSSSA